MVPGQRPWPSNAPVTPLRYIRVIRLQICQKAMKVTLEITNVGSLC